MQIDFVTHTMGQFTADRACYVEPGTLLQDDGRVRKLHGIRMYPDDPLMHTTVVDLGPVRMVLTEAVPDSEVWRIARAGGCPRPPLMPLSGLEARLLRGRRRAQ